jgi:exopolysaccharide biosynthesis polyprenyl glycosylphosphotransferase
MQAVGVATIQQSDSNRSGTAALLRSPAADRPEADRAEFEGFAAGDWVEVPANLETARTSVATAAAAEVAIEPPAGIEPPTAVESPRAEPRPARDGIRSEEAAAEATDGSRRAGRTGLAALAAQRMIDGLALRIAPAAAAGLIASSQLQEPGTGAIVFACVLAAAQLIEHSRFPLELMPTARILLAAAAPLAGTLGAWAVLLAAGTSYSLGHLEAVVLGSWLVLALGGWLKHRLTGGMQANIAVIGSRDFAADLAHELAAAGIDRYEVVGWVGSEGPREYRRLTWLGSLDEVREAVLERRIELLVCDPRAAEVEGVRWDAIWERVADSCLDLPVSLLDANQLYEEALGHVPVGTIDAAWYRYIMHPRFRSSAPVSKRVFDLAAATAIGILFLPVLVVAAIAVKLHDRGPVLYRQRRCGEQGEEFEILKLRTMRVDAEPDGPQWSEAGDARVTRIGRILRRTHADELPQLWNVLRGELTMVGPRPERPEIVAALERRFPHYTRRHLVKPGVAGWAALRCGYAGSDLGTAWKLCHDLFYIKHRSALADALILAETAVEVFRDAHRALRAPGSRFLVGERTGG